MKWIQIVSFIWAFIKGAVGQVGFEVLKDLLALATDYIKEVAPRTDLTNAEKREWVAKKLRDGALATGNFVADSIINLIIEIAFAGFKTQSKS